MDFISQLDRYLSEEKHRMRKESRSPHTRWWLLRGEKLEALKINIFREVRRRMEGYNDSLFNSMAGSIGRISKEVLRESKRKCLVFYYM